MLDPWLLAFALGAGVGVACAWAFLREKARSPVAALTAELDAERRFAGERRAQAERADAFLGQLASLTETHRDLSAQTQHLVDTLRSPVVRGQWGEMQLKRVCELAQMAEHVDFVLQETTPGPEARLRPDRTGELRRHARQVRDHITRLGARAYWEQFSDSPDFVVLFLPGEALFSTALQYDATLIEYGVERNVVLASPTTLIALLRAVGQGWERQRVGRNADEIRALGVTLHDRIESWTGHLDEMRRGLERAVESYNRSVGALEQRVLPHARRFGYLTGAGDGETPVVAPADVAARVPPSANRV
jgi:DNA recombination protein RmuC